MNNKILRLIFLLAPTYFVLLLASCGDEMSYFPDVTYPSGSDVKFLHAASDAGAVNLFVNDVKVTSGAGAGSGIGFGGFFPTINYARLQDGASALKLVVPATSTTGESTLTTSQMTSESGKRYTIALAGISPNYQTVVIDDDLSAIPFDGRAYVRFVNLIHNSPTKLNVVASITIAGVTTTTVLAKDVDFKQATLFMAMDPGDYTIQLRNASTDAVVASASTTNKLLAANRTYTFFARGQIGQTGTKLPTLDRLTNQ